MDAIALYLIPLLVVIPAIVAAVNWLKKKLPPERDWALLPAAVVVAYVFVLAVTYFDQMPVWAKLLVVAALLGGNASGVFDLTKLFGGVTSRK